MITYYTKEGRFKVHRPFKIPYYKLHRENGPAFTCMDFKSWYMNGEKHRLDGPAVTDNLGTKEWWVNGERHRLDGPAIEYYNGKASWLINNKKLNTKKVETWIKNNNINLKTKQHQALFMLKFG